MESWVSTWARALALPPALALAPARWSSGSRELACLGAGLAAGWLLQHGCLFVAADNTAGEDALPGTTDDDLIQARPIAQSVSDLVGNTPMVRLSRLEKKHNLVGKCEFMSVYSLKDRPVKQIIAEAEAQGQIRVGGTLIETTSGNTGMAVASQAAAKGYNCILCMCEIQSEERRAILRALGADLRLSPRNEGTKGAKKMMAEILAQHPEYLYVGQHQNLANPRGHYLTTGPEIWRDTGGAVDIFVAPLGTGGTITGTGRFLKEQKPSIELIAVEPAEAPFIKGTICVRTEAGIRNHARPIFAYVCVAHIMCGYIHPYILAGLTR